MMEKRKVCVVVPTYNNGKTIAAVVRRIAAFTEHIIIVIDGCTDDTREQLKQLSDISFETVDYAENRGKGYAASTMPSPSIAMVSTILRISPCLWRRWSLTLVP